MEWDPRFSPSIQYYFFDLASLIAWDRYKSRACTEIESIEKE